MATRDGSAIWKGDLQSGSGEIMVGSWTSGYSAGSRFDGVIPGFEGGGGTNPEELLAAAHAACFSQALSLALGEGGHVPRTIWTRARVHLRIVDGAPAIKEIDIETDGDVPDLDQETFSKRAEEAKNTCIISRALGGVEQINLVARLRDS